MKFLIDGREYTLTPETQMELLKQLQAFEVKAYMGLDDALRFLLMPLARHLLSKHEDKLRQTLGKEEAARICRPGKTESGRRADPVLHFLSLHMAMSQAILEHAAISIDTDGDTITNATLSPAREVRGPLALDGDQRIRENNGTEIPGRGLLAPVSIS